MIRGGAMTERRRWGALVGILVLVILILTVTHPNAPASADSVIVRVTNGPTVISTQVVPLR